MPRRGENIYKRKDGRWEGRYIKGHSNGKATYGYVYARSYSEVKEKLSASKERPMSSKEKENLFEVKKSTQTFEDISLEWLNSIRSQIKESSYVKYANSLYSYLNPFFSSKDIEAISRTDVTSLCAALLQSGGRRKKGLSSKTIADTLSILRRIFNFASDEKGLSVTNISGISVKTNQSKMRVLSSFEQEKLEAVLCEDLNPCNLGILLCLYTGIRLGEVCALTWGDISKTEQLLHVSKTMQRLQQQNQGAKKTKVIITTPKSVCSIRSIPIPDNICQLLESKREHSEAFILTGNSDNYKEPRTMENHFKKVLDKADVKKANFHSLRHTFATRCVELGFDIKSLSEILGHASVNITLNRYVHPSMELKQKNMNMLRLHSPSDK